MAPVTDVPTALLTGIAAGMVALIAAIPAILGALLILLLGWIITGVLASLVAKALRAVRIETAAEKSGVSKMLRRARVDADAAGVIAGFVKWYLRLIVILMAANAVNLTAVSGIVNQVLGFVPNVLVAVVILAAFSWVASFVRNLVTASLGSMPNANMLGVLAYGAIFGFGVIAAATQIGVATVLIDTLFAGLVAGLALAFGLAFGLGGRDEAAQIWRNMRSSMASMPRPEPSRTERPMNAVNGRPVERPVERFEEPGRILRRG